MMSKQQIKAMYYNAKMVKVDHDTIIFQGHLISLLFKMGFVFLRLDLFAVFCRLIYFCLSYLFFLANIVTSYTYRIVACFDDGYEKNILYEYLKCTVNTRNERLIMISWFLLNKKKVCCRRQSTLNLSELYQYTNCRLNIPLGNICLPLHVTACFNILCFCS